MANLLIQLYLETKQQKYFEEIVIKFKPLLHRYSKKLYDLEYEDSFQELTLTLYEAIIHIKQIKNEFSCLLYIKKTILHKFYSLNDKSKKWQQEKSKKEIDNLQKTLSDIEKRCEESCTSYNESSSSSSPRSNKDCHANTKNHENFHRLVI